MKGDEAHWAEEGETLADPEGAGHPHRYQECGRRAVYALQGEADSPRGRGHTHNRRGERWSERRRGPPMPPESWRHTACPHFRCLCFRLGSDVFPGGVCGWKLHLTADGTVASSPPLGHTAPCRRPDLIPSALIKGLSVTDIHRQVVVLRGSQMCSSQPPPESQEQEAGCAVGVAWSTTWTREPGPLPAPSF